MAERLAYLEAVVGADITEFRKSMRDIRNDVGILSETISGIGGAARTMTFAFTTPMVALGTYAVQAASGFDAAMRNINSIMGLSEDKFQALEGTVMDFAKTTRAGVVPATEALYEIFSAGITDQERAMAVWQTSNKVSEAGLADLTQTTNAITATMSAYNLQTTEASRVGNVWTQMVKLGVGSLGEFLSNSQKILPLSSAMNISLEDMGATLAFLSQGGGGAAKAETSYAMMLSNMMKPTTAMTDALDKLGVKTGTELIHKFGSVTDAVMALRGAVDETTFNKMFSKTGLEAALRLTGNIDAAHKALNDFNQGLDTATMDAWTQQSKSFAFQWDLMKTSLEAVAITIGQAIMPLITPLVQGFSGFLQELTNVNPELLQLGVVFVGVIAAAAPVVWLLTSLINPIGLIVAGVSALGVAFATNFNGIRDKVTEVVGSIVGDLSPMKDIIDEFMTTLFPDQQTLDSAGGTPPVVDMTKHITVTKPLSLWEIYTKQGYDKQFSWDEFMKEAKKGGWAGGIVKVGDMITLSGGKDAGNLQGLAMANGVREGYRKGDKLDAADIAPPSVFERLATAVTTAWPKIKAALGVMWDNTKTWIETEGWPKLKAGVSNAWDSLKTWVETEGWPKFRDGITTVWDNVKTWVSTEGWPKLRDGISSVFGQLSGWMDSTGIPMFDSFGGKILQSMAGWFSPTQREGKTEAYDAFREIFGGGAGQAVADSGKAIGEKFPAITAGLTALFGNIGKWIETEGVPTIARSLGYFVGTLGATIGQLMGSLVGSTTGQGGQETADGISKMVLNPAKEGFDQAMKDKGITSGVDQFFSGLAGLLVTGAGAAVFGQMLLGKGFLPAIMSTLGGVLSGAVTVAKGVGNLGVMLMNSLANTSAGAALANSINNFGGSIMSLISDGLSKAASTVTGAFSAVGNVIMDKIWDAIAVAVPAVVGAADTVMAAIGTAMSVAGGALTAATGWIVAAVAPIVAPIMGALAAAIAAAPFLPVVLAGIAIVGLLSLVLPPEVKQKFSDLFNAILAPGSIDPMPVDLQASVDQLYIDVPQGTIGDAMANTWGDIQRYFVMANQDGSWSDQDLQVAVAIDKIALDFKSGAISADEYQMQVAKVLNDAKNGTTTAPTDTKVEVTPDVVVKPTDDAQAKVLADGMMNPIWTQVAANITAQAAAGGSTDTTVLATGMTAPFVTQFGLAFGDAGTVTLAWQGFVTKFNTGLNDVTNGIIKNDVGGKLKVIQDATDKLSASLDSLVSHSPYEVTVKITTEGTMPSTPAGAQGTDDGHHAVGLDNVPYDGYRAVLHHGEMVLNKNAAENYRAGNALPRSQPSMEVDNSSPTFIVNGVQDFDGFLREAKRRGYNLDKYRR